MHNSGPGSAIRSVDDTDPRGARPGVAWREPDPPRETPGGFRCGVENALLHRLHPDRFPLTAAGQPFSCMGLFELARRSLEIRGLRTGGRAPMEIARLAAGNVPPSEMQARGDGFLVTGDFPAAMLGVARATLTVGYQGAPRTFQAWATRTTLPDFRPMFRVTLGMAPKLLPVPEHGEYQRGKPDTGAELIQLGTSGRIVALTRQAIVNDDLHAFGQLALQFGYAAASMESDAVYAVLTGNKPMADGQPLFSAAHKNLAPAAGIDLNGMTVARTMMQQQQSSDGQLLGVTPKILICGPLLEVAALQFTSSTIVPTQPPAVIPPYFKSLDVVVDPRITDASWYLAASPMQLDSVEYAYFAGALEGGPFVESQPTWNIDGIEFKCREDFAAAAIDYRGLVKTPAA